MDKLYKYNTNVNKTLCENITDGFLKPYGINIPSEVFVNEMLTTASIFDKKEIVERIETQVKTTDLAYADLNTCIKNMEFTRYNMLIPSPTCIYTYVDLTETINKAKLLYEVGITLSAIYNDDNSAILVFQNNDDCHDFFSEQHDILKHAINFDEMKCMDRLIINTANKEMRQKTIDLRNNAIAKVRENNNDIAYIANTVTGFFEPNKLLIFTIDEYMKLPNTKKADVFKKLDKELSKVYSIKTIKSTNNIITTKQKNSVRERNFTKQQELVKRQSVSADTIYKYLKLNADEKAKKIINKLKKLFANKKVQKSQNKLGKTAFKTSMRANRRYPNDVNYMGKGYKQTYRPDIHVYVDTSGSIAEENFMNSVVLLAKIAKKLNVNIYFNSFSDVLSEATLIPVKTLNESQIRKFIKKIPKVSGGTDFSNIYDYINKSKKRLHDEISIIITDFGWDAYSQEKRCDNLYYLPIEADLEEAEWIKDCFEEFAHSMSETKSQIDIANKLLI